MSSFGTSSPGNSVSKRQRTSDQDVSSFQSPSNGSKLLPIGALSPYSGNKWNIVARVTYKSDVIAFKTGTGKLFTIHLLDAFNSEIRCTFYSQACDKFFDMIEINKVYKFSGAKVKDVMDKRYTSITNSYDLTFDSNSVVTEEVDNGEINQYTLNLTKISKLSLVDPNRIVDVMGIVKSVSDLQTYQNDNKSSHKRDITVFDETAEIRLTLWDNFAMTGDDDLKHLIVAFKNVRIGEYSGRSLSTTLSSSMIINPNEGDYLRKWVLENNGNIDVISRDVKSVTKSISQSNCLDISKRTSIKYIRDNDLGHNEAANTVTLKVTFTSVNYDRKPWYDACPSKGCNKKLSEVLGNWHCERCDKDFRECVKRFILSCVCSDHSGQLTLTLYNEQAELLLGVSASRLSNLLDDDKIAEYEDYFRGVLFNSYVISVRLKNKYVKDDLVLESTVLHIEKIGWALETNLLLEQLL